jgi:hypothetical protein
MDPVAAEHVRSLLVAPLDWAYLLRLAARHRLAPLLYRHLSRICLENGQQPVANGEQPRPHLIPSHHPLHSAEQRVPGSGEKEEEQKCFAELRRRFERTAQRNLFLTWQLLELLDAFNAKGIAAIPFKGPVLAAALYHNVGLRPCDDLDIFFHKKDVPRISELLRARGYEPLYRLTETETASYLESNCELCFVQEAGRVSVDVHWGIAPEYFSVPFDPAPWWTRARAYSLGGKDVVTFSPEDLLLYLCIHGTKHSWERLLWLADVAMLLEAHPHLHYDRVFEQAASLHSTRMLGLGLALAKDLLGAVLPASVVDRLNTDRAIPALVAHVRDGLGHETSWCDDIFSMSSFRLKARERFLDRLTYCLKLATLPSIKDWAWVSLPRFLFPLYSILRPLRLVVQRGLGSLVYGVRRASSGRLASHS